VSQVRVPFPAFLVLPMVTAACSGSSATIVGGAGGAGGNCTSVSSNGDAQRTYLGLDASIDKTITLGFQGFNAASSANIPTQTTSRSVSGVMAILGQVDQGQSANKTMRLKEELKG